MSNNGMDPSAVTGAGVPQQQQPQQPQQQRPLSHGTSPEQQQSGLLYDLLSFDPLQAHVLQLTASAGLTTMLSPHPAPVTAARTSRHPSIAQSRPPTQPLHQQHTQVEQQSIQHPPPQQAPPILQQPPQQSQQHQQTYYYMQPQSSATNSLQPIAPATQQPVVAAGMVSQPPIVGQTARNFILPTMAQGTTIAVPANFQPQLFPNGLPTTSAPGMIPNHLLMAPHFQNVVVNAATLQTPQPPTPLVPASKKRETKDNAGAQTTQPPTKKKRGLSPSVVSSSATSTDSSGKRGNYFPSFSNPAAQSSQDYQDYQESEMTFDPNFDTSNMTPAARRRYERNLREQQRSYRISQQIKGLRDVLTESNVPFKPNKYSILSSVVEYIKQLQARAIMLDTEHQKLIITIRQTNELVNSGNTPSSEAETEATNLTGNTSPSECGSDSDMLFVPGLDYRSLFEQCPAALGIAALDGRILECNPEFQMLLGFPRDELMKQSLFNLVRNHQDIFRAMAEMLKFAEEPVNVNGNPTAAAKNQYWSGPVVSKRDTKVRNS